MSSRAGVRWRKAGAASSCAEPFSSAFGSTTALGLLHSDIPPRGGRRDGTVHRPARRAALLMGGLAYGLRPRGCRVHAGLTDRAREEATAKLAGTGFGQLRRPRRGNNGNARRSLGFAQAFARRTDSAQPCGLSEHWRTGANARPDSTSWGSLVRAQYRPSKY